MYYSVKEKTVSEFWHIDEKMLDSTKQFWVLVIEKKEVLLQWSFKAATLNITRLFSPSEVRKFQQTLVDWILSLMNKMEFSSSHFKQIFNKFRTVQK